MTELILLGDNMPCGSYILRLLVAHNLQLRFGRFKSGELIAVPAATYLYIGSALGRKGASRLASRLIRHATRTADKPPHPLRAKLLHAFPDGYPPRNGKTLAWNVDYLLDELAVTLEQVYVLQTTIRLETRIANLLATDPCTSIIAKGLGANDAPGHTHLLRVDANESWWQNLSTRLMALIP